MKKFFALIFFWVFCHGSVMAQACYTSSITNPVPFMGTGQETVTLTDGTKWKITDYTYLYLYSYYPSVTICPSTGKLVVGTNTFNVTSLSTVVVPTTYTFRVCNQSSVGAVVAFARLDLATTNFISHGWYSVGAGSCNTVSSSTTGFRYFYVYAEGSGGAIWQDPAGANKFCVDTTHAFDIPQGSCTSPGFVEKNFIQVDTGPTSTSYVYYLPSSAPTTPTISAQFTASPKSGNSRLIVNFYGTGGSTATTDQLTYLWTFGDGTTSSQQNPVHTYAVAGTYSATLKVSNATGQTATTQAQTISVASQPTTQVNHPPTGVVSIVGFPIKGQTLTATNSLSDTDGMGAVSYQWQSNFVNIASATKNTYVLVDADVGRLISVVAKYTDGLGKPESANSMTVSIASEGQQPVIFGPSSSVCMLNRAFYNISPSNPVFVNQVAQAKNDLAAFAVNFGRVFDSFSNAGLAFRVMNNMGLSPNPALENALTDYFAANSSNRGLVVLQLGTILADLYVPTTADLSIFVPPASAWNMEIREAFIYSDDASHTGPSTF